MNRLYKQLIFIIIALAIIASGALVIYSATPSGNLKIKPSLTAKVKMVKQENTTTTGNNPVGWWKMDETTAIHGSTLADSSGNGNTGTLSTGDGSTNKSTAGKLGKGLQFDGVDDYVNGGDPASGVLDMGTSDFTISAWIKTSDATNDGAFGRRIVSKGYNTGYELMLDSGVPWITVDNTQIVFTGASSVANGQWRHLMAVIDRDANALLYVDGVLTGTANISGESATNINNTKSFLIGSFSDSIPTTDGSFNGLIDDVRVYSRALSAGEVAQQYNSTKDGYLGNIKVSTGLVGYWKMDEASWSGTAGEVIDYSGKRNHGVASGGASTAAGQIGRAGNFASNSVSAGTSNTLNVNNLTISFWLNPAVDADYWNGFLRRGSDNNNTGYMVYYIGSSSKIYFYFGNSSTLAYSSVLSSAISTSAWTFVNVTYDGSYGRIYLNGAIDKTSALYTGGISYPGGTFTFGNTYGSFNGLIDEIKIWNYARTQEQILQDYQRGLRGLP